MRAIPTGNGDVFITTEENDTPVAILKSRELSDDMQELLSQGIIFPVCEAVLKMRKIRVNELEEIFRPITE